MIEIKNLKKIYKSEAGDVTALDDINLSIRKGEVYGIIGLSGAGKSTLIRCMNLLERPTEGSVYVDGQDITRLTQKELRALRGSLGMIFQHFNLLMQRTVEDNVAFPLEISKTPKDEIKKRVSELLELVGLTEKAKSYPAQLSGGQKQRVAIARALANHPKLLLCDEATSALDPMTTKSILGLLKDINRKLGLTIVLITHQMSVIKEICDTVTIIDNARIAESGPVLEVLSNPKSQAAKNLFGHSQEEDSEIQRISLSQNGVLLRIKFIGEATVRPVISNMVMQFRVNANILFGNIDHVQEAVFGELLLELSGNPETVEEALKYLYQQNLTIEELRRS
ncbi:MAG: methionine ABC transporter ATP-binding protein [Clostridia bacterium]|nr:methionine ABC transporter ATP-binding protein [Clostridia bacterium]